MKVAVIDLGTNTFHLLIAEVKDGTYKILQRERKAVRIGEKGINKDEITPQAWDRALKALHEFKEIISKNNISQVFGTATSAIRNAKNGENLVQEIKKQTDIDIEVISGLREAELIHYGAKKAMDFGLEKNLIMDIGGGSIEFIIADRNQAYWMQSFEIGGQRLVEKFHNTDPIATEDIQKLSNYFDKELSDLLHACDQHKPHVLIGCSGTFDTLSDIYCEYANITRQEKATEYPFDFNYFDKIYPDLISKNRHERLNIPGMIEMRVDMIVVACVLVNHLINLLHISNIRVSGYALKEGILFNSLSKVLAGGQSNKI